MVRIHYKARLSEDVLEVIKNNQKVCTYLDIPLQHIDNLLKSMRRGTTMDKTKNLIKNSEKMFQE